MLASALRRTTKWQVYTELTVWSQAVYKQVHGAPAEKQASPQRADPSSLAVPPEAQCLLKQRIGLSDVQARITEGKLVWKSGKRARADGSVEETVQSKRWGIGAVGRFIWTELKCGLPRFSCQLSNHQAAHNFQSCCWSTSHPTLHRPHVLAPDACDSQKVLQMCIYLIS